MSYERGLAAINLQMPDKVPHTEYLSNRQFILKRTGLDIDNPEEGGKASVEIARLLDFDFTWSTFGYNFGTPSAWMGRARYSETEELRPASYDLKTVEEVLSFDALERATNLPSQEVLTQAVRQAWEAGCRAYPETVYPGGFYNSVFTWNIVTFGWDLFLEAAATDMERFDRVMESFFGITMMVVQAHVEAKVPWFLCHDDMVWASGSVFHPDWMRRYVFPRFKRMWGPLLEAGIKVLFCSDGNFTEYIDDVAQCGAEGFIFEPLTDLRPVVERYGKTHVIIGNADCRVLMSDNPERIRAEVERCMDLGKPCPGYFLAVGNHIPFNVPVSAVECYLEAYEEMARR
jgi:hypothetical protein